MYESEVKPLEEYKVKTIALRVAQPLHEKVKIASKMEGKTLSDYILSLIIKDCMEKGIKEEE